jgi:hypothetical protein
MRAFRASAGSRANSIVPTSFSYGPTAPNDCPFATTVLERTVTCVTSADAEAVSSATSAAAMAVRINDSLERDAAGV